MKEAIQSLYLSANNLLEKINVQKPIGSTLHTKEYYIIFN